MQVLLYSKNNASAERQIRCVYIAQKLTYGSSEVINETIFKGKERRKDYKTTNIVYNNCAQGEFISVTLKTLQGNV